MSEPEQSIEESDKFFYVKRFKLIEHETLGFLQGRWLRSKEYSINELMDEFPLTNEFLNELSYMWEAPTATGEWIKIVPLRQLRVIK